MIDIDKLKELKNNNKKIGFSCGTMDLLHAGHISMLAEAKLHCDYLIVGLQNDPSLDRPNKNSPIQSIVERQIQLHAVVYVDDIVVYNNEKDLEDLLKVLPIDVRILGDEYKDKEFTGKDICVDRGIEFYFNTRTHSFSSTELRKRVFEIEQRKFDEQKEMLEMLKTGKRSKKFKENEDGEEINTEPDWDLLETYKGYKAPKVRR